MATKLRRGDTREDGMVFWCYAKSCKDGERWLTPEQFESRRLKHNRSRVERLKEDPLYNLSGRIRARLGIALRKMGYSKTDTTENTLGCSFEKLKEHIEKQFTEGMSWDNRHLWHVDHILPLAAADNERDLIALAHYTNLRPLWAVENMKKSGKHCPEELKCYLDNANA